MFSPHLYNHKFDIDDLITALLEQNPQHLNTHTGALTAQAPQTDAAHSFQIHPLPPEWLQTLPQQHDYAKLTPDDQTKLSDIIQTTTQLVTLIPLVQGPTMLGGWLRERLKTEALQWLDEHNLIPPSMRHVASVGLPGPTTRAGAVPPGPKKVILQ